jgi:hypothetical protein
MHYFILFLKNFKKIKILWIKQTLFL